MLKHFVTIYECICFCVHFVTFVYVRIASVMMSIWALMFSWVTACTHTHNWCANVIICYTLHTYVYLFIWNRRIRTQKSRILYSFNMPTSPSAYNIGNADICFALMIFAIIYICVVLLWMEYRERGGATDFIHISALNTYDCILNIYFNPLNIRLDKVTFILSNWLLYSNNCIFLRLILDI